GPEHVAGGPVDPVPPPSLLVVLPFALVDQQLEPVHARVRITRLVQLPPPGARITDPVGALAVPVRADQRRLPDTGVRQARHDDLVLIRPDFPAKRRWGVARMPPRRAPDVQGHPAERVPETGAAAVERAGERLDAVAPQQAEVVAPRPGAQGRYRLAARAVHQAAQAGVVGEP